MHPGLVIGVALCTLTCSTPPAVTTPPRAEPTTVASVPESTDPSSDKQTALDGGVGAASGAPTPPRSDAARFACAQTTCQSKRETCCLASDEGLCVPTERDGPHGTIGFFKAQFEVCSQLEFPKGYSMSGISRCDESIDCAGSELCCEQFLFSGGSVNLCEPAKASGKSPCEYGERCLNGTTCRTPNSVCRRGHCEKRVDRLRCVAETCAAGESCCGGAYSCKPDAECKEREPRITCTRPSDCAVGHHCVLSSKSASCTGLVDFVTPNWLEERGLSLVCERDAECKQSCEGGKKRRCVESEVPWLKSCACR